MGITWNRACRSHTTCARFFETCLNSDPDRADQLALAELFIMDQGRSKIQNEHLIAYANTENPPAVVWNESTHLRAERVSQGKDVTLIGKLKSSFLMQDKKFSNKPSHRNNVDT